jgi:uncharacterized protein (DUF2336 family)
MPQTQSLIAELEDAVQSGSKERRIDTLRRVTDLFLTSSNRLNSEQIEVFDDVLGHLVRRVEARALAELSERLAKVDAAPVRTLRGLAFNDEIEVARPVLTFSKHLSNEDLVEVARTKGQSHLLAISDRDSLHTSVTDILIERGDRDVHRRLASNAGAQFSDSGYGGLVRNAAADDLLTELLGSRPDIPRNFLKALLEKASRLVREKLLAVCSPEQREMILSVFSTLQVDEPRPTAATLDRAMLLVKDMNSRGELSEVALAQFAAERRYAELIASISLRSYAPSDLLASIFEDARGEATLIPCKAAGLSWTTVKVLIEMFPATKNEPQSAKDKLKEDYLRLTLATAQRVVRFWCVQRAAGKDILHAAELG